MITLKTEEKALIGGCIAGTLLLFIIIFITCRHNKNRSLFNNTDTFIDVCTTTICLSILLD